MSNATRCTCGSELFPESELPKPRSETWRRGGRSVTNPPSARLTMRYSAPSSPAADHFVTTQYAHYPPPQSLLKPYLRCDDSLRPARIAIILDHRLHVFEGPQEGRAAKVSVARRKTRTLVYPRSGTSDPLLRSKENTQSTATPLSEPRAHSNGNACHCASL